jgi:hypothetical protein
MKARCGSQAEVVDATAVGGQGGGICGAGPVDASAESVTTPGEVAAAAANRFWYVRIVLRSIPVTRSISRWLAPASSSVQIVVCKCGFKTFTPRIPSAVRGGK